jgi:hypothetical protein
VLTPGANNGNGDIFISPFGGTSSYANGAEIINNAGHVIWFRPVPAGQEAADFRTQTYRGHPVLTWWQGTGLGGLASGTDYIYNDHYQQIATVQRQHLPRVPAALAGNRPAAAGLAAGPAAGAGRGGAGWCAQGGAQLAPSRRPGGLAAR